MFNPKVLELGVCFIKLKTFMSSAIESFIITSLFSNNNLSVFIPFTELQEVIKNITNIV